MAHRPVCQSNAAATFPGGWMEGLEGEMGLDAMLTPPRMRAQGRSLTEFVFICLARPRYEL